MSAIVRQILGEATEDSVRPVLRRVSDEPVEDDDDVYAYELLLPHGKLEYESNGKTFWLLNVEVEPRYRWRGIATRLLDEFYRLASEAKLAGHDKTYLVLGAFTTLEDAGGEDGYGTQMLPMVRRLARKYSGTVETVEN